MAPLACRDLRCRRETWGTIGASILDGLTAEFEAGVFHGISGPNGCGKSLLLSVLGLLEPPDSGDVFILGEAATAWEEEERREACNEVFGFVFSHPCLLPSFTVAENVAMPLFRIFDIDAKQARDRTLEVLEFTGLVHLETELAGRLAPAERQRASLARALVHSPRVLVADNPRGEEDLLPLGVKCARDLGLCVLWAGETPALRDQSHKFLEMREGRFIDPN